MGGRGTVLVLGPEHEIQKDAVQAVGVALGAAQWVRDREHAIAVIEQRGDDAVPAR